MTVTKKVSLCYQGLVQVGGEINKNTYFEQMKYKISLQEEEFGMFPSPGWWRYGPGLSGAWTLAPSY